MAHTPAREPGHTDPTIGKAKAYLREFSYGKGLDRSNKYTEHFGLALKMFAVDRNAEINRGTKTGPKVNLGGVYDWPMKVQLGVAAPPPAPPAPEARRKIWFYSAPGSGADANVGPAYDVGEFCRTVLHLNHVPLVYPKGGYLGVMGGDPGLSYNEVIAAEGQSLELALGHNPDIADPELEMWFCAYSQSADGMEDELVHLFGDGGIYASLRSRINGVIQYGNPSRQPGPTKVGNTPPGWGISRKTRPDWLKAFVWDITAETPNGPDTYACTTDDTALPLFYEWFVKAETSLTFMAYSAGIIIPALTSYLGFVGIFAGPAIAAAAGLSLGFVGQLIQSFGGDPTQSPNPELVHDLSAQGMLTPQGVILLFKTLAALPGIQTHGSYYDPHPEFNGRNGIQVGCDIVAAFRR
jgi:hypothetical protein